MSSIFGGSKETSKSYNQGYGLLKDSFSPMFKYAGTGAEGVSKLLGGDASGFNAYKDATGFDALSEIGSRGITGNAAARGLLRSGSAGKALVDYGNTMNNQYAQQFIQNLLGLSDVGLKAGSIVGGAGEVGEAQKKSKPGIGGFLGQIGAGIAASDRRLKKNIKEVGKLDNGLTVYDYDYIWGEHAKGVMADEVAILKPEALGPVVYGYQTVDYSRL